MTRYLHAHKVEGDTRLRLFPEGRCQWCGKELPGRFKSFCPGLPREGYDGETFRHCVSAYWYYWYGRPRYQRKILLRDDFTCMNCGLRPTIVSSFDGVERPDLGRLHVDHIVPYSKVRETTEDNLQVLCAGCNLMKGANVPSLAQGNLL